MSEVSNGERNESLRYLETLLSRLQFVVDESPAEAVAQKTGAALFHEALELQGGDAGTVSEMVVDGCLDQLLWIFSRPLPPIALAVGRGSPPFGLGCAQHH